MISIVIPVLNEASSLLPLLQSLSNIDDAKEVIIVDGGSCDNSVAIAERFDTRVMTTSPSRGKQLFVGASAAQGDIIVFIHADTIFPPTGLASIQRAMQTQSHCIGGNFKIRFDGNSEFSLWLNKFYDFIRKKGFYYGDSCIFIRKQALQKIGNIRSRHLMEDYDLVRRMQKYRGGTIYIQNPEVISSSRRFHGRTKQAIILGWLLIHLLYYLRIPSAWLAWIYDSKRRREHSTKVESI